MKCSYLLRVICFSLILLSEIKASAQTQKDEQITVDGMTRKFTVYIPVIDDKGYKAPVVLDLHGGYGTGRGMMGYADFRPEADQDKFIIICPDGLQRSWNDGRATTANKEGINDVKFIDNLITYIIETYNADKSRVYITGMSNGGFMTSRLACELYKRVAAIAVVGASMDKEVGYEPKQPMPVMYIQGTADPLVPFEGGQMTKGAGGPIYGHEEILQKWIAIDKCSTKAIVTNFPDSARDGTTVTREEYDGPNNLKVIGYTLNKGGHVWPGSKERLPRFIAGIPCNNLDACRVIWDFFKIYKIAAQ